MMLERFVNLSAEHQASIEHIVATCGLSAQRKDQSLEQEESVESAPSSDVNSQ